MYKLSKLSKQRREGIDLRLIEIDNLAITLTLVDYGHPVYSGLRTAEEQSALYQGHLSKCDGYTYISKHQLRKALDFYAYVKGESSWKHHHLAMVGAAYLQAANILGFKIKWGGLWKKDKDKLINGISYGWDMGHIELID